jgi:hypothetical protein
MFDTQDVRSNNVCINCFKSDAIKTLLYLFKTIDFLYAIIHIKKHKKQYVTHKNFFIKPISSIR